MKLYFNGCSHTFGDDLLDKSQSWPALIAKNLGFDFLNDAVSGGTNDRILYRTIKHAHNFDKFYIAWTYTSRFTRYRSDNNHDVNFNPQLKNTIYGNTSEFKDYGKIHYSTWHNELYAFKIWLQNVILLQRYFESMKKPYIMINSDHNHINQWTVGWNLFNDNVKSLLCFDLMDDQQLYNEHTEIQNLTNQINTDHYIGWDTWWITSLYNKYSTGPTRHLLEDGHNAVANFVLTHDSN